MKKKFYFSFKMNIISNSINNSNNSVNSNNSLYSSNLELSTPPDKSERPPGYYLSKYRNKLSRQSQTQNEESTILPLSPTIKTPLKSLSSFKSLPSVSSMSSLSSMNLKNLAREKIISFSEPFLTIRSANYDLSQADTFTKLISLFKGNKVDIIKSLMGDNFSETQKIFFFQNDVEKIDRKNFFRSLLSGIIDNLKLFFQSKDSNDSSDIQRNNLLLTNTKTLLDMYILKYEDTVNLLTKSYQNLLSLKNKTIVSLQEISSQEINVEQKIHQDFYSSIDLSDKSLPSLFSISGDFLIKSGYINDIGEIPYKTDNFAIVEKENSLVKIVMFFDIIKLLLTNNGFSFPSGRYNEAEYLNKLFYTLLSGKVNTSNELLGVPEILYRLVHSENIIHATQSFIDNFSNPSNIKNSTPLNKLAIDLKDILLNKETGKNDSLNTFLFDLNNWYVQYGNYFSSTVENQHFASQKTGFIAQNIASNNVTNSLTVSINGQTEIADLPGRIGYGKKIYSLLKLSTILDESIILQAKNILKDKTRLPSLSSTILTKAITTLHLPTPEKETQFEFDYWQKEAVDLAVQGKSFILSGDTSGGKTSLSVIFIDSFLNSNPKVKILIIVPTDPLAFQIYANLVKTFSTSTFKPRISIYTDTLDILSENMNILIGTPKDLNNILSLKDVSQFNDVNLETKERSLVGVYNPQFPKFQFDKILIDEIHTMSTDYDTTIEGTKRAISIQNLLKCASPESQIIGFSATLSENSIQNLKNFIYSETHINMNEIIYTFNDIGKSDKNKASKTVIRQQVKYIISDTPDLSDLSGEISDIGYNSIHKFTSGKIVPIDVNGRFMFRLLKSITLWGKNPCAIFPGNESDTLEAYSELISFLDDGSDKCVLWNNLKKSFSHVPAKEQISNTITFLSHWFDTIFDNFLTSKTSEVSEDSIPYNECSLIEPFNNVISRYGKDKYNSITLPYISPETYGLMFEIIHLESFLSETSFRRPFSGKHPFYRFLINELREGMFSPYDSDKRLTRFGELLSTQRIDFNDNSSFAASSTANVNTSRNPLLSLILNGINYGIGIITSTVPFAIQCEIVSYLNKTKSNSPLPFIFCDTGMSMGINYSFLSTCILLKFPKEIPASQYFQIKGRAGRRGNPNSILITPDIYLVNVSNGNELNRVEDSTYTNNGISPFFYTPKELIDSVQYYMLETYLDNIPIATSSYTLLLTNKLFPVILNISTHSTKQVQIRLMKLQVKELFDRMRDVNPQVAENYIRTLFNYIQNVEYQEIQSEI